MNITNILNIITIIHSETGKYRRYLLGWPNSFITLWKIISMNPFFFKFLIVRRGTVSVLPAVKESGASHFYMRTLLTLVSFIFCFVSPCILLCGSQFLGGICFSPALWKFCIHKVPYLRSSRQLLENQNQLQYLF